MDPAVAPLGLGGTKEGYRENGQGDEKLAGLARTRCYWSYEMAENAHDTCS
jgi:hypothetical protein